MKNSQANSYAFAALRDDGAVVTWGDALSGGDSSQVADSLHDVVGIQSGPLMFAAIKRGGQVVLWGEDSEGHRVAQELATGLQDVTQLQLSGGCWAAISKDGRMIARHLPDTQAFNLGPVEAGAAGVIEIEGVRGIQAYQPLLSTVGVFAAIRQDGRVTTWGDAAGSDSRAVQERLTNVACINASLGALAALRSDGSVVTWGKAVGANSSAVQEQLVDITHIQVCKLAFAAIRSDGAVIVWGAEEHGGDASRVQGQLRNVKRIQATDSAFAAIRMDGSVVTWGSFRHGGNSSSVRQQLGRSEEDRPERTWKARASLHPKAEAKAKAKAKSQATAKAKATAKARAKSVLKRPGKINMLA